MTDRRPTIRVWALTAQSCVKTAFAFGREKAAEKKAADEKLAAEKAAAEKKGSHHATPVHEKKATPQIDEEEKEDETPVPVKPPVKKLPKGSEMTILHKFLRR